MLANPSGDETRIPNGVGDCFLELFTMRFPISVRLVQPADVTQPVDKCLKEFAQLW